MKRNFVKRYLLLFALLLSAAPSRAEGVSVVTTLWAACDWAQVITEGVPATVTMLAANGDLHSYQPTVDALAAIAACDVVIFGGGESDAWVRDALRNSVNARQVSVSLLDALGGAARPETLLPGMEPETEPEYEHEQNPGGAVEMDEHVWLSLRNAAFLCRRIAEALAEADPENREAYAANAARYAERLAGLDREYQAAVDGAGGRVLLFGDRFPFRYLAEDYGLTCYAAFPGCSAESEASFETLAFLMERARELDLPCVLALEGRRHRIAETVAEGSGGRPVLTLDSMQAPQPGGRRSYISVMEENLRTLRQALASGREGPDDAD